MTDPSASQHPPEIVSPTTGSALADMVSLAATNGACCAWNHNQAEAATPRLADAGAELATTFALACELQAARKLPTADTMLRLSTRTSQGKASSARTSETTPISTWCRIRSASWNGQLARSPWGA